MTQATQPIRFYDQILRQLELGETRSAIFSLAGIFDGVIAVGSDAKKWRESLLSHPLFDVITALETGGDPAISALGSHQAAASRQTLTNRTLENTGQGQLLAVEAPDSCDTHELADELVSLRGRLLPDGRIFISSFVPGHLGWGWQQIVKGAHCHCHDEQSLEVAASAAELSIQHFRDASDCLVWAVLQHRTPCKDGK